MTDRIPLDDMTSDQLDTLYARRDQLASTLREALDCITLGLGIPDPDDFARWRTVLHEPTEG